MRRHELWIIYMAAVLSSVPIVLMHRVFNPSSATCSASIQTQLEPTPLSTLEQKMLQQVLPQPTSEQLAVRGELRAPFHIPCQLQSFPHLEKFVNEIQHYQIPDFMVKEFAQPPHLIFFDKNHDVVRTIVVSPAWTEFKLRDLVQSSMKNESPLL